MDGAGFSSPPQDTQAFSQFVYPTTTLSEDVKDEAEEGVWGYLLPLDQKYGKSLVLKKRNACPLPEKLPNFGKDGLKKGKDFAKEEDAYEQTKFKGIASGGYLIGRHPECGKLATVFERHLANITGRPHYRRSHSLEPPLPHLHREQRWGASRRDRGSIE